MTSFDDIRKAQPRAYGFCPKCGQAIPVGAKRGRIQLVLYGFRSVPKAERENQVKGRGKKGKLQETETLGSESRTMCESCSVDTYLAIIDELPARRRRADRDG